MYSLPVSRRTLVKGPLWDWQQQSDQGRRHYAILRSSMITNTMMGSRLQTTAMFLYFCLDDWVPADHLGVAEPTRFEL